jgi:hypothetical protein
VINIFQFQILDISFFKGRLIFGETEAKTDEEILKKSKKTNE